MALAQPLTNWQSRNRGGSKNYAGIKKELNFRKKEGKKR